MFISILTKKQQGVFLGLAKQLISADSKITKDEELLLSTIQAQMESGTTPINVDLNHLGSIFDTKASKASMLLELLGLAHADEEYHLSEKEIINQIAKACGISDTELVDMESWVIRQFALVSEAKQFMEE